MILKYINENIQSEAKRNIETMRRYIYHHFARMREICDAKCIPSETWAIEQRECEHFVRDEMRIRKLKHDESELQRYAKTNHQRRQQIDRICDELTRGEVTKSINKLNNRKSVGKDKRTKNGLPRFYKHSPTAAQEGTICLKVEWGER